ncbi:Uncharacterised protein [Mycobacterium tuberculosis]|uniref:Uncharacterized protein n=1 Tax=Mycobacterium tuberculosis TaxID=1773 RepID=A0A654ZYT8_MYCTX|nr:Uncharacterised protein [Mycobacterium tuberculosis]CKR13047.1 Uncharacterised protein [Mycobacterium tuberculosis]CKR55421.1 Uncharacterised protein [Mycobacterium tuberculosis]COW84683.1 Uncharacterised protein [Mycobacterium tuberculosis]COY57034.1 Uncharacterised protein [Mycobacterium tuberculosis]
MGTARRMAEGSAPRSAKVVVLNSITFGWSISYTTVLVGHGSR